MARPPILCVGKELVESQVLRGGDVSQWQVNFEFVLVDFGHALRQGLFDFAQQVATHVIAGSVVEPVEEPTASRRFAEAIVGLEAALREELFDLADAFEAIAVPAAETERTRAFDGPILHAQ